jgi:hypothetical protein
MFFELPAPSPVIAIEQLFLSPESRPKQAGTCTDKEKYDLAQEVSRTCKGADRGSSCKKNPDMTPADRATNAKKFEACAVARETISKRCFGVADEGHRDAAAIARAAAKNCREI